MSLRVRIEQGVKRAADAVEAFVNDVGDAVGGSIEVAGDGIHDALVWAGNRIGLKPVFSWLGSLFKGGFAFVGAGIKGFFGVIGGTIGGMMKLAGGLLTWQGSIAREGAWDIGSPIAGAIIVIAGKLVALIQSLFYLQEFERPLTEQERAQLQTVFKDSLNYYVIRLVEGRAGLFGINDRPFALGNTIYLKTNPCKIDLLVHETTHVWQYQHTGDRYTFDALTAQWFVDDAYNWQKEFRDRHKRKWTSFNNEAQAQFLQDLWRLGQLRTRDGDILEAGNGLVFSADGTESFEYFEARDVDYSSIAREAMDVVRRDWF